MPEDTIATLSYIGPEGTGLGFQLAGMNAVSVSSSQELLDRLKEMQQRAERIIFVDEGLAESVLEEIEQINEELMPTIVLLANPLQPRRLTAKKLERLMIKAVGSDIFGSK